MSRVIAIDAGGSTTRAGLYEDGALVAEVEGGPGNALEASPESMTRTLLQIREGLKSGSIDTVTAGVAGAGIGGKLEKLARLLRRVFDAPRVLVSNDLLPITRANLPTGEGLVGIAGTGSSVWGRNAEGLEKRGGGYGPILGDEGSAYRIVIDVMRHAIQRPSDGDLIETLTQAAGIDTTNDLPAFVSTAQRAEIAALCPHIIALAESGHEATSTIVDEHAQALAQQVLHCKNELHIGDNAALILHGGVFQNSGEFMNRFAASLHHHWSTANPTRASIISHEAAYALHDATGSEDGIFVLTREDSQTGATTESRSADFDLDALTADEIALTMHQADLHAANALLPAGSDIAHVMTQTAEAFDAGGRLIYLGAGTSGRLGVLDASECPPTFGVPNDLVIGLIAGGDHALRHSIEGAEDDPAQGAADLDALNPPVNDKDVVVGITASGTAPYVLGALDHARNAGAHTALICCNPVPATSADTVILIETGPEVLPGSTRLKAGTATKMVLNQITTGAMALWGHVYDGYMVGVKPVNVKLRDRAVRITAALTNATMPEAEAQLDAANGSIPCAVLMAKHGLEEAAAQELLQSVNGRLRQALEKLTE